VIAVLACAGTIGCAPQLQLVLNRADDLAGKPEYLRIELEDPVTHEPFEQSGPHNTDTMPSEEFAEIPPDTQFVVDVIGCKTSEIKECESDADFLARGCSPVLVISRGGSLVQQIDVHNPTDGAIACADVLGLTPPQGE
jgi:hypothetical protein